jgi:predicted dehydrogenase
MIKWGIIGCGDVTERKSGPAFNKVKDSQLIAVMRRNSALAEEYARRHKVPKWYSDANDLINDRDINAVYVATPPGSHAEYTIKAVEAGKPVYVEKPMAANYSECLRMIEASEKNKVPVYVAYYRRALPGFLKVKELIQNGSIGKVRFVQIQLFFPPSEDEKAGKLSWIVDPEIAGAGHFFDLACHELDYLDFLFGPVIGVKSTVLNQSALYKAEDFVSAHFLFNNNITVTGTWCFNSSSDSRRDIIEIFGEKGTIRFSCFTFDPIVLTNNEGIQKFPNETPENIQFYLIEQVVNSLMGNGVPVSTAVSGARTSKVMDEVVREYYKVKNKKY